MIRHPGGLRDAILFALSANATNGLRRSNADKRRAVTAMLDDPEWSTWSNVKIAKQCGVSDPFVMSVRASLLTVRGEEPDRRTYLTRHGTIATMDVSRIGRASTV